MSQRLHNARVFDGERIHTGVDVVLRDGRITALSPAGASAGSDDTRVDLGGGLLAPGFIDVQVNGGDDVLFNTDPSVAGVRTIAAAHRRFGTTGLLPTLISDHRAVMEAAVDSVRQAIAEGVPGVLGIHLEGPYLNAARHGIHRPEVFRPPERDAASLLSGLVDRGRTLVTLAPEQVPVGFVRELTERGVVVCAGHSAGSHEDVQRALAEGLRGFTHLFNAMTPMTSRDPGVVGAALADPDSYCGLIVDGHHVHPLTLRVALAAKARGRMMLVTDAVHVVGSNATEFDLLGETLYRRDGRVTNGDGTLAGSDLTMDRAVANAVELLGQPLEEALRMASLYPAAFLGLDGVLGRIAPGYRGDLVLLDDALKVKGTWIDGQYADA